MRYKVMRSGNSPQGWDVIDSHKNNAPRQAHFYKVVARYIVDPAYYTDEQAEAKAHETATHMNNKGMGII